MSKGKPPLDVARLRAQIEGEHGEVNEAADALTKRLNDFQTLVAKMKGRVETTVYKEIDQAPGHYIGLRLTREGKEWVLKHSVSSEDEHDPDIAWAPVAEASVRRKINLAGMLPSLLENIADAQALLKSELHSALATVDEVCLHLGADTIGGAK